MSRWDNWYRRGRLERGPAPAAMVDFEHTCLSGLQNEVLLRRGADVRAAPLEKKNVALTIDAY